MKIVVLNGSPKGNLSTTMQYVHFIEKKFQQHEVKIFHVAERINAIEKDENRFQEIIDGVTASDGVLWALPLYYFLVCSQYKRFIELLWERKAQEVFKGKYAATLSTSIHFFDHTAHNYMNALCDDLEMKYVGSFSAEMFDLLKGVERGRLLNFGRDFFEAIEKKMPTPRTFQPLRASEFRYIPGGPVEKTNTNGKKTLILTDVEDPQSNLGKMVQRLRSTFSPESEVISLSELDIKGGCLGCLQCGYDNECAYTGKDQFIEFFNSKVKKSDILVFAGTIRDRYLSSRWKLFFDRSFFHTHQPYFVGKQVAFLISGPLSQIPNLRQILEAYAELQRANLVGFVTDEWEESASLDALLSSLASRLVELSYQSYVKPRTFLGIGGSKIFRDDVWARLRFPFIADHKYYRKHGMYDFPQKDYKARMVSSIMTLLTKVPRMRKEIYRRSKVEMVKPLQKVVEKA